MDPLTLAGLAMSGGSVIANMFGQNSVSDARSRVLEEERARQAALDAEVAKLNTGAQNRYVGFGGQQATKSKGIAEYLQGLAGTQPSAAMPASRSAVTNQAVGNEFAKSSAYGTQQNTALGNLRSFGDVLGDISRGQARDAGYIGQLGGFKTGSAGVTGLELDAANNRGGGMKLLGDLLGLGGQVGLRAGIGGGTNTIAGPGGWFTSTAAR